MEAEIILKEITSQKDDYRVVQRGDIIESINKQNQVFHYIDLSYVKKGIFLQGWVGYRTTDQLKAVLEGHYMKLFIQHKCKNSVVDSTKMSGSFNEATDWLAQIYMPKLINLGLKNVAVVLPTNVFAQLTVDEWDKKVGGFESRNFGSLTDAVNWLKTA
jgi:hypothetical protein